LYSTNGQPIQQILNHLTINAMLETYHKFNPKPKTITKLKSTRQQIWDDLPRTFAISSECMCFGQSGEHFDHQIRILINVKTSLYILVNGILKDPHIENSKNHKRRYCLHHTDVVTLPPLLSS